MHELSLCGAIADVVTRHAEGRAVQTIHISIGQLRQIVPDTLVYCWSLFTADTSLAGSRIDVEHVPARLACRACGERQELGATPVFACPSCAGVDLEVVTGEEFLITSLDLAGA
ncbi:hydrogenase maturation nickel metallochaperone HypA [Dactylosporangium sp. NPDC005572]|uniref:hydrogenase maturation nickel metallochaperone HypA n=1 Tax=Dactylosporangium sp. NPDC005572 TaxID=3156889 RepID=UPI0033B4D71A